MSIEHCCSVMIINESRSRNKIISQNNQLSVISKLSIEMVVKKKKKHWLIFNEYEFSYLEA